MLIPFCRAGSPRHYRPRPASARQTRPASQARACVRRPASRPSPPGCLPRRVGAVQPCPCRRSALGPLIWAQIAPSERPCQPIDAGARRQPRFPGPPRGAEVRRMMAGAAGKPRRTVSVDAAHDPGPVRLHAVGLGRSVVHRMAVQAARILQDLARFSQQGDRSRVRVGKRSGLTERALRRGAQDDEKRGGTGHQEDTRARHVSLPACGQRRGSRHGCAHRWHSDRDCR